MLKAWIHCSESRALGHSNINGRERLGITIYRLREQICSAFLTQEIVRKCFEVSNRHVCFHDWYLWILQKWSLFVASQFEPFLDALEILGRVITIISRYYDSFDHDYA